MNITGTTFNVADSITVNINNTNAVDIFSPLSLINWIQYVKQNYTDINILMSNYNQYLKNWYSIKNVNITLQKQYTTSLYISLFKEIAVNYSSAEEQRFIQNIDYSDSQQILACLPFFVRKIKQICLYFTSLRETLKTSTIRNNLRGSNNGIEKILYHEVIQALNSTDIQNTLNNQNINLINLKQNTSIEIEELYDTNTSYYDLSADSYDARIFYNLSQSTAASISSYPIFINELGTNNFSITLDNNTIDLSLLKNQDFITQFNNLDPTNLKINLISQLVEKYIGTDFYYLSTDSTGTNYISGILFSANQIQQNILNKRFPSIAQIPNNNSLQSKKEIGGFFTPDKVGITNFYSFSINYQTDNLKPNTVYTFPDPNKYGNISNLTQISFDSPFLFYEDPSFSKISNTNTFQYGDVVSDPLLKTFYGYRSISENRGIEGEGIERYTDSQEFFTGINDNIWANIDAFPIQTIGTYPISNRTQSLLTDNTQTLVEYKTDIYGNEYGLFKKIKQQPDFSANIDFNTCLTICGGKFTTISYPTILYTGNNATTSSFNVSGFSCYIISPTFFPKTFCDSIPVFNLYIYTGVNFNIEQEYIPTIWDGGFYNPYTSIVNNLDGGKFLINGQDITITLSPIVEIDSETFFNSPVTKTQLLSVVNTIQNDITIYNERENTYGNLYFRNVNNSITSPASSTLATLYVNYNSNIINEINNNLKHFDVIYNTLILETKSYTIFDSFKYDTDLNILTPQNNLVVYINTNNQYEKISNIWYDENTSNIFISKTTVFSALSASNAKAIYPTIYLYKNNNLQQIYPSYPFTDYSQVSGFSLSNTEYNINITTIEKPLLSYNSILDKYCITCIARDPSNQLYVITYYFRYNTTIYDIETIFYKPACFNHSENFTLSSFSNISQQQAFMPYSSNAVYLTGESLIFN